MTHDQAFADFQKAKRVREAAIVKVSWRKVDAFTGGGSSGLAADGRRVYVDPRAPGGGYGYGTMTADGEKQHVDFAPSLQVARFRATLLVQPPGASVTVLSPQQLQLAQYLCLSGGTARHTLLAATESAAATLSSLVRLGLVTERKAGGRDPLYHLTDIGRALVCAHEEDAADDGDVDAPADEAGPLLNKEVPTMTDVKPDPKPTSTSSRKRSTAKNKPAEKPAENKAAENKAAEVPPVKDVTDKPPEAAPTKREAFKPLFETLLAAIKDKAPEPATVETKSYVRVLSGGKTVAGVFMPTSSGVRVSVPRDDGPGFTDVTIKSDADTASAVTLVEKRVKALSA